ncbi:hypothetical protein AB1N83_012403 [Pleurotus pulmonarius]
MTHASVGVSPYNDMIGEGSCAAFSLDIFVAGSTPTEAARLLHHVASCYFLSTLRTLPKEFTSGLDRATSCTCVHEAASLTENALALVQCVFVPGSHPYLFQDIARQGPASTCPSVTAIVSRCLVTDSARANLRRDARRLPLPRRSFVSMSFVLWERSNTELSTVMDGETESLSTNYER